jgi:hypothetical protein
MIGTLMIVTHLLGPKRKTTDKLQTLPPVSKTTEKPVSR